MAFFSFIFIDDFNSIHSPKNLIAFSFYILSTIIYLLEMIYFVHKEIFLKKSSLSFFRNATNIFDIILLLFCIIDIIWNMIANSPLHIGTIKLRHFRILRLIYTHNNNEGENLERQTYLRVL